MLKNRIVAFSKEHILLLMYTAVFMLLMNGLLYYFGLHYALEMLMYFSVFIICYFLFYRNEFFGFRWLSRFLPAVGKNKNHFIQLIVLFLIALVVVIYHLISLKSIPLYVSYESLDYYQIAFIRQNIIPSASSLCNYLSSFVLKGILPFLLLYAFIYNKRVFYFSMALAIFYAMALIQKSYIVGVLTPLIIYTLCTKQFKHALLYFSIPFLCNYILVYVTNPQLRANADQIETYIENNKEFNKDSVMLVETPVEATEESVSDGINDASFTLYKRVFLTTGKMVGYWFEIIPDTIPFAEGCAYTFIAPLKGCKYTDFQYEHIIYKLKYPKEAKIGLKGTCTVAHFMYDYANFGNRGLLISAIVVGAFLAFLSLLFRGDFVWNVCINALPILWLSSASFTTILFSGSWFLLIILYVLFLKKNTLNSHA